MIRNNNPESFAVWIRSYGRWISSVYYISWERINIAGGGGGEAFHCKAVLGRGQPRQMNEMNFVMNHAPGAGSIAQPVGQ